MGTKTSYDELEQKIIELELKNKQLQKKIEESESKYGCLFDQGREGLTLMRNRVFIDCNQAVLNILNLKDKKDFLNHRPADLSPEFQPDGIKSAIKAERMMDIAEEEGMHRFEWVHRSKYRSDFLAEITLVSTKIDNENLIYAFWRDITERVENKIKIQEQYQEILTQNEEIKSTNEELRSLNEQLNFSNKKIIETNEFLEQRENELQAITLEQDIILGNLGSLVAFTREMRIIWSNSMAEEILGYSKDEIMGLGLQKLIIQKTEFERSEKRAQEFFLQGKTFTAELEMKRKDGNLVWCNVVGNAINHENLGEGVIWIIDNISERKEMDIELKKYRDHLEDIVEERTYSIIKTNEKLEEEIDDRRIAEEKLLSEKKFNDILIEGLPGIFYLYELRNGQTLLRRYNKNFEALSGYTPQELINMSVLDFIGENERLKISNALNKMLDYGSVEVEAGFMNKNGSSIPFYFSGYKFENEGENYFMGVGVDISARKAIEERLIESKERYRKIVNASRAILWEYDWSKEAFVHVSGNVLNITGFTKKDWLTSGFWYRQLHAEETNILDFCQENAIKGEDFIFEHRLMHKTSEVLWFRNFVHVISSKKGSLRVSGMMIDITKQKFAEIELDKYHLHLEELVKERTKELQNEVISRESAEKALRRSLLQLESILTNIPIIIWMIDKDGVFTFFEGSELKLLGLQQNELIGKSIFTICEVNPKIIHNVKKSLEGETCNFEAEISEITYKNILSPNFDKYNNVQSVLGVAVNITDRKRIEIELKKAKEQAETANYAKSEFLANMSHEIRTPMNAILGFSEILREKLADYPDHQEFINGIFSGGRNLLRLIDDILDLSKVEAGHMDVLKEPVNPHSVIKEIKQIFKLKIREKGLKLNIEIREDSPDIVLLDETRIRQVLFNLVGNAVKYTKAGEITVTLYDKKTIDKGKVELIFEVTDTGIGIPLDQQEIIFEPFRQRKGQRGKYQGTGLGLAISKKLVEMMNGKITVKSEVGKGSTFTVSLPDVEISTIAENFGAETKTLLPSIQFKEAQVLYAEDVLSNRQVVKAYLENYHLTVIEAVNGKEAINLLNKAKVDLILMDIEMPLLNGMDAAKQIRSDNKFKNIPIIALTASAMKTEEQKILKYCDEYLRKPISKSELVTHMAKYLPHFEVGDENLAKPNWKEKSESLNKQLNNFNQKCTKEQRVEFKAIFNTAYEEIRETYSTDETEEFAKLFIKFGSKHNLKVLTNYGNQLLSAVASFRFDEIEYLVSFYPDIFNKMMK